MALSTLELTHRPLGLLGCFPVAPSSQNTRLDQHVALLPPGPLPVETCNRWRSGSRRPLVPSSDRGQTFANSSALRPRRCVRSCHIPSPTTSRSSIHHPHLRASPLPQRSCSTWFRSRAGCVLSSAIQNVQAIASHPPINPNALVHDSFRAPSHLGSRNRSAPRTFARAYVRLSPFPYPHSRAELPTSRCVRTSEAPRGDGQHLNSRRFTRGESTSADYGGGSVARERHACARRLRAHIWNPGWIGCRFIHRRNR
jgi:hypothetical protein